jgi:lipopolysaccharide/colanic/teichoic acid biosynthesis glycosyltransferase
LRVSRPENPARDEKAKMKSEQLRNRILAADLAWIPAALMAEQALCAELGCNQLPLGPSNFVVYVICTVLAWILLSENLHLDGFRTGWRLSALLSHLLLAIALLMVILLAVENVSERYLGRFTLSVFSLLLLAGFLGIRGLALRSVLRRYQNGKVHRVVILGSDRLAGELAVKFNHHPELLCRVIGFLCPRAEMPLAEASQNAASGPETVSTIDVVHLLRQNNVDELVMAHTPVSNEILNLVALCRQQAIQVSLVPQPYELYLSSPRLLDLGGLPLLQLGETAPVSARISKRVLDIGLGVVLAIASLPAVAVCAAILRFSTGSAFRWERRIGWRGVQFSMLRLNVGRDPQAASRFERMLWQLSVSELPQLWNVFRGEMSLVGPRPEGPERAHRYSAWQEQRLSVKPGMTGLAQVRGLREQHPSEDKTRHDLQYMLHPSLLKDLSLLIETMWTLTARLLTLSGRTHPGDGPGGHAPPLVVYSPSTQPFSELLQHAHRAQSGSD